MARKGDVVDTYHGVRVADPYRWMENPDDPEVVAWVEQQNRRTESFVSGPARQRVVSRLKEIWNYPRETVPARDGEWYFFLRNDGLQNQAVLYAQKGLDGSPKLLLDPNALSEDGTVSLNAWATSADGTKLAYGLSSSGSDQMDIRVRNVETGEDYPEVIRWCKMAGIAWKHDGSGFWYNRYPAPGTVEPEDESRFNKLYWHKLGTSPEDDVVVYERPDAPDLAFSPMVTQDGKYLLLWVWRGTDMENRVYCREADGDGEFVRLLDEADAMYSPIDNVGSVLYMLTNLDAPRGRVIAIDLNDPAREKWKQIVPEAEEPLSFVSMVNEQFVLGYLRDAQHALRICRQDGSFVGEVPLPGVGTVSAISGKREDKRLFVGFTSFLYPPASFVYDFESGQVTPFRESEFKADLSGYETQQVFYRSKDGTRVPMFLTHKKGLKLDGNNPTILYGYGGFYSGITPYFSVPRLAWLEMGGVYAVANIRGGDEYGDAWHKAGKLANKQNVFDDFIAAGEWLIANRYTSNKRLAIEGGSNGGLLVAACMLQRPDLWGAVVCQVPVTDMLRYHKFTVGHYWIGEYGNAETDPEAFRWLYAYSPLHNVKDGQVYPPILVTSADTDDRVVPAHAKKFVATLQEKASPQSGPILLRVETRAGHGGGKPVSKIIEEEADTYAFLMRVFGVNDQ